MPRGPPKGPLATQRVRETNMPIKYVKAKFHTQHAFKQQSERLCGIINLDDDSFFERGNIQILCPG